MTLSRRTLLKGAGLAAAAAALGPLIRVKSAFGSGAFKAKRVVILSVAGGLRLSESLGMTEGATMPNMLGEIPLLDGYGRSSVGPPRIAPEYPGIGTIVLPKVREKPLFTEGALITNLRYAEGAPGHLQGAACLTSGMYNTIDNRADAHVAAPTLFELHRRQTNAPATDAFYLSVVGGFYRAIQASSHPDYGPRYGASWLSPPPMMSPILPIITSGQRSITLDQNLVLPIISDSPEEAAATRRLSAILDGNTLPFADDAAFRAAAADNAAIERHLASIYGDPTYQAYFPKSFGIGIRGDDGSLNGTGDASTIYHAEQILERFKPSVMVVSLIDIDAAHQDFNAYLLGQTIADACVSHLWSFIQSTEGLRDETALLVLPEHGRQLAFNGKNPDSLGRSGLDHGGGDDGDRDVFLLALGPDFSPGVYAPTNVSQAGRNGGRYETIDAVMTAATLLGYGETMASGLVSLGQRPGLVIEEILA